MTDPPANVGRAFLDASRHRLAEATATIEHCLRQLPEDDLRFRPHERLNAPSNIILHLCGNLRQWIISGVGGAPDVRERQAEFDDRAGYSRDELLARLRGAVEEADAVLSAFDERALLEPRRIQGFDVTPMSAIIDTVSHFVGHVQEIIYITRMRCGDAYEFRWKPRDAE